MIYTKDYLINAYLDRYVEICDVDTLLKLEENANKLYDEVGKDKFRTYASLDAQRLKEYRGT
jgi:hypothetical protein